MPNLTRFPTLEELKERIAPDPEHSGCMVWLNLNGSVSWRGGESVLKVNGRYYSVRELVYKASNKEPLENQTITTTCWPHSCVNPDHLVKSHAWNPKGHLGRER